MTDPDPGGLLGFTCPYCGELYSTERCDAGTGQTILCCGELHCEPYYESQVEGVF